MAPNDPRPALPALLARIDAREARVGVVGLGYVGLPLSMVFAEAGFRVLGFDVNAAVCEGLNDGASHIEDVASAGVAAAVEGGRFAATTDFRRLADVDAVIVCVPTPLRKTRDPDMTHVAQAAERVAATLRPGQLVVLESTSYPGTTREVLLPMMEAGGLRVGHDFFLAFSPERVDPGRTDWTTKNTPKVVGGVTPACRDAATALYGAAVEHVVPVSSPEAAEMTKIYENTFRAVNIGLANELLLMCDRLGLDVWEVLDAAGTKPFGFMKFTPGPGLGGHCIPVDPHYLAWKLRGLNYTARFIELASEVNTQMPTYWVRRVQDALNDAGKALRGSTVVVLGVAYKRDVADLRESPALDILHLLHEQGAHVRYCDPFVPSLRLGERVFEREPDVEAAVDGADAVVLVTDHAAFTPALLARAGGRLLNTRGRVHPAEQPVPAVV